MSSPGWPAAASSPSTTGRASAPVQGEGTRPVDLRPGDRPGPHRVRPAGRIPTRLGGDSRRRHGLACDQPPRLRHGRERARSGVAAALGDHADPRSTRYLNASPELRTSLRDRLVGNLGDAADSILRFIESGAGADALALAIVCQVVYGEGKDSTLEAAAARMEQYHGNKPIPPSIGRCLGACCDGCRRRSGPQGGLPGRPTRTSSGPTN